MTDQLAKWKEAYPEAYAKTIQGIPAGRFGDPEKGHRPYLCLPLLRGCQVHLRRDHHHAGRQRPASVAIISMLTPGIRQTADAGGFWSSEEGTNCSFSLS